ncbi:uncharacterized protein LOC115631571 [Scaptodrosophila lebanonensis]|uniref:Uncharacterized protein LOC115631571 n=1 Tax=Drosophila lebanonensis TaxID=7225 RepID=A0A6J2U9P9_DROLE|nr:uncharacterized protein LOC115631571 [Scaptodrosophila lebanonensis]
MSRNAYLTFLLILASSCLFFTVSGRRTYPRATTTPKPTPPPIQTPKEYLESQPGLSTFGIIVIIFFVIVLGLVFYYGVMCYPFLCREEKKYRFMDVSSTITAATSRSIQSIENYPVEKHHQMA